MLDLERQSLLSRWLVSVLSSAAALGESSRHSSSIAAMYSPLEEYSGTMAKLGALAKSDFSVFMSGEEERFTTHLAMLLPEKDVPYWWKFMLM